MLHWEGVTPFLSILTLWAAVPFAQAKSVPLFLIEKSSNRNVVHYDALLGEDGFLSPKRPILAYWEMREKDGQIEELTGIEHAYAYGFSILGEVQPTEVSIELKAISRYKARVAFDGDVPRAEVFVDDRWMVLQNVYVVLSRGLIPGAKEIRLKGVLPPENTPIEKVIHP